MSHILKQTCRLKKLKKLKKRPKKKEKRNKTYDSEYCQNDHMA